MNKINSFIKILKAKEMKKIKNNIIINKTPKVIIITLENILQIISGISIIINLFKIVAIIKINLKTLNYPTFLLAESKTNRIFLKN
jgi:hypothetical protein